MRRPTRNDLADGRLFHALIARFYAHESEFDPERVLIKAGGRPGRADLFLWAEPDRSFALVIEVKWTDWDRLAGRGTVRRNLASHRRQVWEYLEGRIFVRRGLSGDSVELEVIDRQAALAYPAVPRTDGLRDTVESELGEWGITTNWFDEPPPADSAGGRSWTAIATGDIATADLRGSRRWADYLDRIRRLPATSGT